RPGPCAARCASGKLRPGRHIPRGDGPRRGPCRDRALPGPDRLHLAVLVDGRDRPVRRGETSPARHVADDTVAIARAYREVEALADRERRLGRLDLERDELGIVLSRWRRAGGDPTRDDVVVLRAGLEAKTALV